MANSLNEELMGKTVRLKKGLLLPKYENMEAVVDGGFGASSITIGRALFVTFKNGEKTRLSGDDVLEIVS